MANTSDIRNGLTVRLNGNLMEIIEFQHVKPGKGNAFVRTKLKNIETGKVLDNTFPAGSKIDEIRIERHEYQYLYRDGDLYVFMNNETYEQINIQAHLISAVDFLQEGQACTITFFADEDKPIKVELPDFVEMEITYTEPGIKGDTATNTLKPATVENGVEVRVPLFINTSDFIKIDTRTASYVERVKK